MPFDWNLFPFTDFNKLNLDWVTECLSKLTGGLAGQFLRKKSNDDFDFEWKNVVESVNGQTGDVTISSPVTSVNGKTGDVILDADDVGAIPAQDRIYLENDYITPEMFGAVGDGTTDDYLAIYNCLQESSLTGKPVNLIATTYFLNTGITLDGVRMFSNCNSTLLFKDGTSILVTVVSNCTLRGFTIENNAYNYDSFYTGMLVIGSQNRIDNVYIKKCFRGLQVGYGDNGVAYNYFHQCYVRNCAEGIYVYSTGSTGFTNENAFTECTVRIDGSIKTVLTNKGLNDRYAVVIEKEDSSTNLINSIRFIDCNVEGCFNGFSVRAYYCVFINCRTDAVAGIYYYFHQTRGGYNFVYAANGTGTDGGQQRVYEVGDDNVIRNNNVIMMRNYNFVVERFRMYPRSSASRPTLTSADKGFCLFDSTNNKPIWWTGTKWVDGAGTDM